jgi:hypothetical protein
MEFIYKTLSFWKLVYQKLGKKGIWQYSLKNKVQNFEKDFGMQYAMNAWWNFYSWKIWVVTQDHKQHRDNIRYMIQHINLT